MTADAHPARLPAPPGLAEARNAPYFVTINDPRCPIDVLRMIQARNRARGWLIQ